MATAVVVAGVALIAPPRAPLHPTCVNAEALHHAAVVIEHSDGSVITRCVGFDVDSVTGEDLLTSSGIEWEQPGDYGGMGAEVCQIDNEPATYPAGCWTSTSRYWAFYAATDGGGWQYSRGEGASSRRFRDGDAAGFHYQPQGPMDLYPPSFEGVCVASAPSPTPGPTSPTSPVQAPSDPSPPDESSESPSREETTASPVPSRSALPTGSKAQTNKPVALPLQTAVAYPSSDVSGQIAVLIFAFGGLTGLLLWQVVVRRRAQ